LLSTVHGIFLLPYSPYSLFIPMIFIFFHFLCKELINFNFNYSISWHKCQLKKIFTLTFFCNGCARIVRNIYKLELSSLRSQLE
jgi:hypothetical protein